MDTDQTTPIQELARQVDTSVLVGPPGTGKTTELSRLVTDASNRGWLPLIASLTKTAAQEVAGRELPIADERVGTLHAHAYRALGGPTIAESKLDDWNDYVAAHHLGGAWEIAPSYGKRPRMDDPSEMPQLGEQDERSEGQILLEAVGIWRSRMVQPEHWPSVGLRAFHRRWCEWKAERGYLDFTDLIERCFHEQIMPAITFDAFYLDEAQDSSRLEMSLALRWARQARAMIVCGDPRQNLYEWRGSEPSVLYELIKAARRTRVLEQSYRVSAAVHGEAQGWVAQLNDGLDASYRPRPVPGSVESGPWLRDPSMIIDQVERDLARDKTVMLLTACGYLLNPLVHELRERGLPFFNPYRRTNGRWNPLQSAYKDGSACGRLQAFTRVSEKVWGSDSRLWTGQEIRAWAEPLSASVFVKGAKAELGKLRDEGEIAPNWVTDRVANADDLPHMFDGDLWWYEQHLLPSQQRRFEFPLQVAAQHGVAHLADPPKVIVGTVHSVKGGEADTVYLWPDLSPGGFDEWTNRATRDRLVRLFYVGMTRSRESLVLGAASSARAVQW